MILYCDFNPRLTRVYEVDGLNNFGINSAESFRIYPSGYGVDSYVFAKNLLADTKLIGLFGGERGEYIKELIKDRSSINSVKVLDSNVEEIILKSNGKKTIVRTSSPRITVENKENFISEFSKEIKNSKIVCLPETDHSKLESNMYEKLINLCYSNGIKVAVTSNNLQNLGTAKPYIFVSEKSELEKMSNQKLKTERDIISFAKEKVSNGIGIMVINTIDASYIISKNQNLKANYTKIKPYISKVNSNLMLTGMAIGFERDYDIDTLIKLGVACCISENFIKFRLITMPDIKQIMNEVSIESMD